jgi:uncharacterized membrane protein YhaH (DUF805 family)
VGTIGVVAFWVGVFVAASLVDGYSSTRDYISSLAGRGSSVAVLGVAAIAAVSIAHFCAALVLRGAPASRAGDIDPERITSSGSPRAASALLGLAGVALLVVAAFRAPCPGGAAGCGLDESFGDAIDVVHVIATIVYEILVLGAMVAVAVRSLRGQGSPRWMGVYSVAAAIASVLLLSRTDGADSGLWQRLWLVNNLSWLLVVMWIRPGMGVRTELRSRDHVGPAAAAEPGQSHRAHPDA